MATFSRTQLETMSDKEHSAPLSFYCLYWNYNGLFFSKVVQAHSKRKAHIILIDDGVITENTGIYRYQFII